MMGTKYDDQGFLKPDELLIEGLTKMCADTSPLTVLDGLIVVCQRTLTREPGSFEEPDFRELVAALLDVSKRAKAFYMREDDAEGE